MRGLVLPVKASKLPSQMLKDVTVGLRIVHRRNGISGVLDPAYCPHFFAAAGSVQGRGHCQYLPFKPAALLELQLVGMQRPGTPASASGRLCATVEVNGVDVCSGIWPIAEPGKLVCLYVQFGREGDPRLDALRFEKHIRTRQGYAVQYLAPAELALHVHFEGEPIPEGISATPHQPLSKSLAPATDYCRPGQRIFEMDCITQKRRWVVGSQLLTSDDASWTSQYNGSGQRVNTGRAPFSCIFCGDCLPPAVPRAFDTLPGGRL